MAGQALLAVALIGVLLAGVTAYAMNMGIMGPQEGREAYGMHGEGRYGRGENYHEGIQGMDSYERAGTGHEGVAAMPMMGHMGGYGYMHEECEEMMKEHGIDVNRDLVTIEGIIVGAEDYGDVLKVRVGDETIYAKIVGVYVEPETGYMVSGHWIFESIEKALDESSGVEAKITGTKAHAAIIALGMEVESLGTYESPALFDENH